MRKGTTCIEAANWGRNSIGVEFEPKYHQLAREKISKTYGMRLIHGEESK